VYFFLLAYTILGGGIKYIDAAYDDKIFSKTLALLLAPFLALLWAFTMLIDPYSATILFAILLGVLIKGKIDNPAHLLGFFIILVIIALAQIELIILPLIFLVTAAVLDEIGNDNSDNNKAFFDNHRLWHKCIKYFFGQRWTLKIAILVIALLGIIPIYFFLAMLLFDYSYLLVHLYSRSREGTSNSGFSYHLYKLKGFISDQKQSPDITHE
jgi:hypothetical protein